MKKALFFIGLILIFSGCIKQQIITSESQKSSNTNKSVIPSQVEEQFVEEDGKPAATPEVPFEIMASKMESTKEIKVVMDGKNIRYDFISFDGLREKLIMREFTSDSYICGAVANFVCPSGYRCEADNFNRGFGICVQE